MKRRTTLAAVFAGVLASGGSEAAPAPPLPPVLEVPGLARGLSGLGTLLMTGADREAERLIAGLAARFADRPELALAEARLALDRGDRAAALAALAKAADLGAGSVRALLARAPFDRLAGDPEALALADRVAETLRPPPAPADGRDVPVTVAATGWDPARLAFVPRIEMPTADVRPLRPADRFGPLASEVNRRYRRGDAAGHVRVLYDNRDRDHSGLQLRFFPQLARTRYGPGVRQLGLDYGPNTEILFDAITFGNSSTALTRGPLWRSQARRQLTEPGWVQRLARQYEANHLYVYPEHRDHDPGRGDLFPANTPYQLISQGSSGSDRPFLFNIALALAALQPETRDRAEAEGLIAPTLQLILRRAMALAPEDAGYLDGTAHPTAFEAHRLDKARVVEIAARLRADALPPMVRLEVLDEAPLDPAGPDAAAAFLGERLFDTPSAIARIHRRTGQTLRMRISAAGTRDPNGRPLAFFWRVLRGDAARIRIETSADGSEATLTIPWHEPAPIPGDPERLSHRVDIGVFAHNGVELSAPAFLSVSYPPRERRVYDDAGRIRILDHADPARAKRYADPMLFAERAWSDRFLYDGAGTLIGWDRKTAEGTARFTAAGDRVLSRDGAGRPRAAERVRYVPVREGNGPTRLEMEAGALVDYHYEGPGDLTGFAMPLGK